jgi:hypothetical protein
LEVGALKEDSGPKHNAANRLILELVDESRAGAIKSLPGFFGGMTATMLISGIVLTIAMCFVRNHARKVFLIGLVLLSLNEHQTQSETLLLVALAVKLQRSSGTAYLLRSHASTLIRHHQFAFLVEFDLHFGPCRDNLQALSTSSSTIRLRSVGLTRSEQALIRIEMSFCRWFNRRASFTPTLMFSST